MVRAYGALWVLALCACQGPPGTVVDAGFFGDADAGAAGACGSTLKPAGKACVPTLASCAESEHSDEVPAPGGGCQRVGVEACDGGLRGPPDWTCKRVGPPTTCLAGWAMTEHGWCEPVLPGSACPDGEIEVIGKSTCQPIADCGSGTWGNIQPTADTLFVDQAYPGSDSDGSQAKPFTTVGAALAALPADRKAHIAVAAGAYDEQLLVFSSTVVLEGRCPQMVTLQLGVATNQSKVTLRGLTVRSNGIGVDVMGGVVVLERAAVVDCGDIGVLSWGAKVTLRDSVVARNYWGGVLVGGQGQAELERTVVRDALPDSDGWYGYGVRVELDAKVALRDSVVSGNHEAGISFYKGAARIERSVIRDTRAGPGITPGLTEEIEVVDCLVAGNQLAGVWCFAGDATLERTVVRDNLPQGQWGGVGIAVVSSASAVVRDSVVAHNRAIGIAVAGSSAVVERTQILDTLPGVDKTEGNGIEVLYLEGVDLPAAKLTLTDAIVAGNRNAGIWVYASEATLERTLVQDTLPRELDGYYGIGVLALARIEPNAVLPAKLSITDSTITGSAFSGLAVYGSDATVETSVVRDTREPSPRRWGGPGVLVSSLGKSPSTLQMKKSLVADASDFGVYLEGSQATLEGSAIKDTQPRLGDKAGGFGVYAWPGAEGVATKLLLHDCQVSKSGTAGLYVADALLDVQRCQVTGTAGDSKGFGDGIMAQGPKAQVKLLDSEVAESLRCGLLSKGAGGQVDRSLLTRGLFSVVLDQGAPLQIGDRVELTGNTEDRVTLGKNLVLPLLPEPPPPPEPPDQQ